MHGRVKRIYEKNLKEQDIDSFINTELAFDGEILKVKQTFIDPVNQKEYGSIDYDIAVIFPGQPDSKAKLELYKSENNFKVLEENQSSNSKIRKASGSKFTDSTPSFDCIRTFKCILFFKRYYILF